MAGTFYACEYARQVGEQLFATASHAKSWVLLEYPRPWEAKAYEASAIPDEVKTYLDAQMALMPSGRLQLISHNIRDLLTHLTLYVIHADWGTQHIRRFTLPSYDDLRALPLADIVAGRVDQGERVTEPLYLVCTNSKRDICCARHGVPLYRALRQLVGDQVWQTNHLGGHRFAGTMAVFPHGISYGWMSADDAPLLVEAVLAGDMLTDRCRGRACLEAPAQAAEHFLREQTGIHALDAFAEPEIRAEEDRWFVRFARRDDGKMYEVVLTTELSTFDIISNSSDSEGKPKPQYRLLALTTPA